MDIILFGMQGSGKGTQGKILAQKFNLTSFDMGGALRAMIASGSDLGNKIKTIVESGELVSDDIILEVIADFVHKQSADQRILFDGIPRTMHQMTGLLELLQVNGRDAFGLLIKITEEEAVNRLTKRRICVDCKTIHPGFYEGDACKECGGHLESRKDDTDLGSIQKRIDAFKTETTPVIQAFEARDHLITIDGQQDIEAVTKDLIDEASHLFK